MQTARLLWTVIPALALIATGPARAAVTEADFQMKTLGDLVDLCTDNTNDQMMTAAVNFCHGFAVGVYQTLAREQLAMRYPLFCLREPMLTRNQAIADLVAWAKANPSAMSEAPSDGILHFLSQRYPCASR